MRYLLWQQKLGEWHPGALHPLDHFFYTSSKTWRGILAFRWDPSEVSMWHLCVLMNYHCAIPGTAKPFFVMRREALCAFSHVCRLSRLARGVLLCKCVPFILPIDCTCNEPTCEEGCPLIPWHWFLKKNKKSGLNELDEDICLWRASQLLLMLWMKHYCVMKVMQRQSKGYSLK